MLVRYSKSSQRTDQTGASIGIGTELKDLESEQPDHRVQIMRTPHTVQANIHGSPDSYMDSDEEHSHFMSEDSEDLANADKEETKGKSIVCIISALYAMFEGECDKYYLYNTRFFTYEEAMNVFNELLEKQKNSK